jgi:hypothetical protein
VKVFGTMPIWRDVVGWVELAKPSFQRLTVLPMLGFVPQPSLREFLHSLSSAGAKADAPASRRRRAAHQQNAVQHLNQYRKLDSQHP